MKIFSRIKIIVVVCTAFLNITTALAMETNKFQSMVMSPFVRDPYQLTVLTPAQPIVQAPAQPIVQDLYQQNKNNSENPQKKTSTTKIFLSLSSGTHEIHITTPSADKVCLNTSFFPKGIEYRAFTEEEVGSTGQEGVVIDTALYPIENGSSISIHKREGEDLTPVRTVHFTKHKDTTPISPEVIYETEMIKTVFFDVFKQAYGKQSSHPNEASLQSAHESTNNMVLHFNMEDSRTPVASISDTISAPTKKGQPEQIIFFSPSGETSRVVYYGTTARDNHETLCFILDEEATRDAIAQVSTSDFGADTTLVQKLQEVESVRICIHQKPGVPELRTHNTLLQLKCSATCL